MSQTGFPQYTEVRKFPILQGEYESRLHSGSLAKQSRNGNKVHNIGKVFKCFRGGSYTTASFGDKETKL